MTITYLPAPSTPHACDWQARYKAALLKVACRSCHALAGMPCEFPARHCATCECYAEPHANRRTYAHRVATEGVGHHPNYLCLSGR